MSPEHPLSSIRVHKGRGAVSNPAGRYEHQEVVRDEHVQDWEEEPESHPATTVQWDQARTLISRNNSPDIPFRLSVNPYRGCEHGCSYCFARPSHSRLNLSPGLDFETRLFAKREAARRLRHELDRPGYRPETIVLGINTDGWQPVERRLQITRQLLEVLAETRHPVSILTKSALIERDLDLLAPLADQRLVTVAVSITTLDRELGRRMEPRAASPQRLLRVLATLSQAGIPVGVSVAPVIPGLTDQDLEGILEAAARAGACHASWGLLRLPHELAQLFPQWLEEHFPARAAHVMELLRQCHGGNAYNSSFGQRMKGTGTVAELLEQRFRLACKRLGFARRWPRLRTDLFQPPRQQGQQQLFS